MKALLLTILLAITVASCELVGSLGTMQDDADLVGVTWMLSSFQVEDVNVGKGCVDIKLVFTEAGEVKGESERNSYVGQYEADSNGALSIYGPAGLSDSYGLFSTLVGEPSCSRYVEYLRIMARARSYAIEGDNLRIRSEKGIELHFEAGSAALSKPTPTF